MENSNVKKLISRNPNIFYKHFQKTFLGSPHHFRMAGYLFSLTYFPPEKVGNITASKGGYTQTFHIENLVVKPHEEYVKHKVKPRFKNTKGKCYYCEEFLIHTHFDYKTLAFYKYGKKELAHIKCMEDNEQFVHRIKEKIRDNDEDTTEIYANIYKVVAKKCQERCGKNKLPILDKCRCDIMNVLKDVSLHFKYGSLPLLRSDLIYLRDYL